MGKRRVGKKVQKLEKRADELRQKAEKRGRQLQERASDRIEDLQKEDKRSRKGLIAALVGIGAGAAVMLKRKRDQELDEALWEEPRSI